MKSWLIFGTIILLVAGIIVYNKVIKTKPDAAKAMGGKPGGAAPRLNADVYVVRSQNLDNTLFASGTLLASEEVELKPEISGRIVMLNIKEGQVVNQGTLLLKLNDADLQAQLKKLQMQTEPASKTEQRLKQLLAINGVGQQDYDIALTQYNNILADIDLLKAQIEKTEIRAPFTGKIGLKNVSQGAYVTQGAVIASLQQITSLKVDFSLPEKYVSEVKQGETLHMSVDGFSEEFSARIAAVEPKIDEATRTLRVRALVNNSKSQLYPGAFAKINLNISSSDALMVPTNAIIPEARGKKVFVVKGGKAEPVMVQTGFRNENKIQVVSGLEAGDTVMVSSIMMVKPGVDVKVGKVN
jgi:membrane fusion protein (multidrug efflux system)